MKKLLLVLVPIILVTIFLFGKFVFSPATVSTPSPIVQSTKRATVEVKSGQNISKAIEFTKDLTALGLTQSATSVETKGEGELAFVISINNRVADETKREFWKLFINGEEAQIGAGSYQVQNGDTIAWEIDTY